MKRNVRERGAAVLLAAAVLFSSVAVSAEDLADVAIDPALAGGMTAEVITEAPTEVLTEVLTEAVTEPSTTKPTETVTEKQTEPATAKPTETVTEKVTEPTTAKPTETVTEKVTEPSTTKPTEAVTEKVTEPSTAKATEAVTEKVTEPSTTKPTEAVTEKVTEPAAAEPQTEAGVYAWEKDGVSAEAKVPESITLPEGAQLKLEPVNASGGNYEADIALVEKAAQDLWFGEYLIYDIRFETEDGAKVSLDEFKNGDGLLPDEIEVKITFDEPIFQNHNLAEEETKVFHIRSLTAQELEEARAQEAEEETGDVGETETESPLTEGQKAAELKAEAELSAEKNGVQSISFHTDGFSDFVIAVTAPESETDATEAATESEAPTEAVTETEPQTEAVTEAPTEAATETEPQTEAVTEAPTEAVTETEPQTEAVTEAPTEAVTETEPPTEAITEAPAEVVTESQTEPETEYFVENLIPIAVPAELGGEEAKHKLTVRMNHIGADAKQEKKYTLLITGENLNDPEIQVTMNNTLLDAANTGSYTVSEDGKTMQIPVAITGDSGTYAEIVLANLPAGTYTVDGGGTYFKTDAGGKVSIERFQKVDYTTAYQVNGANVGDTQPLMNYAPVTVTIADAPQESTEQSETQSSETQPTEAADQATQDQNVAITNVFTQTTAMMRDKATSLSKAGAKLELTFGNTVVLSGAAKKEGQENSLTVKGIPLGSDTGAAGISYAWKLTSPASGYIDPAKKTESFSLTLQAPTSTKIFESSPTRVWVNAAEADGHCTLSNVPMRVLSGTTEIWNGTAGTLLEGILDVNKTYTVEQTKRMAGHVITKKSYTITVKNHANDQGQDQATQNRPTLVHAGALLKADKSYMKNVPMEIRDASGKVVKSFTSKNAATDFVGELEPGTYTLVETKLPSGYYTFEQMSKQFTIGEDDKTREATVSIGGHVTVKITISRKAYDDTATDAQGKDVRYMLPGSVLRILDSAGTIVDEWTTTDSPYVSEGKLNVNEKYTLVEVTTPEGYEKGGNGEFSTYIGQQVANTTMSIRIDEDGKITPSVTMQSGRARGRIRVAMRVAYQGTAVKVNRTYYCALFKDSSRTEIYSPAGVKPLKMTSDVVYATADFERLPAGTYYIGETDSQGNLLSGNESSPAFSISYTNGQITLAAGSAGIGEILNNYQGAPDGGNYSEVDPNELDQSYRDQYADYGGSAQAAAAQASDGLGTTEPVATGDTTQIIPYIIAAAAALLVLILALLFRKKKK